MIESKVCCRDALSPGQGSPFDWAIAFDYHDGLVDGLIRCSGCGREFRIKVTGIRNNSPDSDDGKEIRDYELCPIPDGSMARFSDAMAPYEEPRYPDWVPTWRFPSDRERNLMEGLVNRIYGQEGPVELVAASSTWPTDELLTLTTLPSVQRIPEAAARSIIQ